MFLFRVTIVILLFSFPADAQNKNISQTRKDLKEIRSEIEDYKNRIQHESAKEKSILDMVAKLDQEIDMSHALLEQLKQEEKKNANSILQVAQELKDKRSELERIQEVYAKRLVNFYKHGRIKDIELLLSSHSFNQMLVWLKYQKILAANDRRNYNNILKKKNIIEGKKDKLKIELITKRQIIKEKTEEEDNLKKRKSERSELLQQIQQNKQLYVQKLREYEISAREIERLISNKEEQRRAKGIVEYSDFPQLKGKMVWPIRGEIITKFGKYQHPQLKTITESIGVDIRADFGEDVRSVGNGVVTVITWQRGRGNIVIINHFGGYYTVYTHLSQISVEIDQQITAGQVIGEAGDSGSLKGPILHFEIWQNNKVLDPLQWLS